MGRPKNFSREEVLEKAMAVFWKHHAMRGVIYCFFGRRPAEANGFSTGDADRIRPPPSRRVTALSTCGEHRRSRRSFRVPKIIA